MWLGTSPQWTLSRLRRPTCVGTVILSEAGTWKTLLVSQTCLHSSLLRWKTTLEFAFREKSRLYVWNMTVGSRSFEHPINGTTRRRLSRLVDVGAGSNALTCSQGSKCDFVREVQRGDRLWVGNQEFTVYDHHEHNSNTYFHPGKITLGKKGDSGSEHQLIPLQLVESLSTRHTRVSSRLTTAPCGKWRHSL